ncbi:MAG: hypothetical protein NTX04_09150, partial [Verrucomicrobia bacterium]|nr:hypothetical protein [Verrucomicrobiota bacterium]
MKKFIFPVLWHCALQGVFGVGSILAEAAGKVGGVVDKIYGPADLQGLRAVKGQTVVVEGLIVCQGQSRAGAKRYLNFTENYQESISLVFDVVKGEGEFTKEKLASYVGKKVRVTGMVGEYQGSL